VTPRKGDNIATRLLTLSAAVLRLLPDLARQPAGKTMCAQLARCASAGGSNYEEARGAESPADFVHKIRIALKEVREMGYWLRLIEAAGYVENGSVATLVREADELIAILTASSKTAQRRIGERG
jgi:four helix bundle protein